jgi:hypothetical protein
MGSVAAARALGIGQAADTAEMSRAGTSAKVSVECGDLVTFFLVKSRLE